MNRIDYDTARGLTTRAKNDGLVIKLKRVGAAPFIKYSPYTNSQGVEINMWSCISFTAKAMPDKTLLFSWPHIIDPKDNDDYSVNMLTTEWVVKELSMMHPAKVELVPVEDSPFAGNLMEWREDRLE